MTHEEIHVRSQYLFLTCSQAVEQFKDRLMATFSSPPLPSPVLERLLRRELGLLFRYWTTRKIWAQLETDEAAAKQLNLVLLRLFTERFKLPKDGSGLRYAGLSTPTEELHELSHRLVNALGLEHPPLLMELSNGLPRWREVVLQDTVKALELPVETLSEHIKQWPQRGSDGS